jgi:hypothetical protein
MLPVMDLSDFDFMEEQNREHDGVLIAWSTNGITYVGRETSYSSSFHPHPHTSSCGNRHLREPMLYRHQTDKYIVLYYGN